jgi:DNA-directed RNA polymerase III subunit RPC11
MHFCPICSNLLLIEESIDGMRFCCPTCPFRHNIRQQYSKQVKLKRKVVDDVLGGADAWENVDRTEARCPHCHHGEAYFMQIQIRSADEPSTTFYKCVNCMKQWND